MTKSETYKRLVEWQAIQQGLDAELDAIYGLMGCNPESPLLQAIYVVVEAHTDAVAEIVGDKMGWLDWWKFESQYGAKPMKAAQDGKPLRTVKSLKQLAGLIAS